ncbi:MAG: 1,4-alpha-glucan branching protein GlgB [Candidatus Tectomicrobia bacterium]|nr:1,4-alpha-glucan branching protein GlgB [Candidatus Tectomicrobia bacterium]
MRYDVTLLSDDDLHLFNEGTHFHLYEKLGAHPLRHAGDEGTYFAVWAPNAERVAVIGDFNGWAPERHALHPCGVSGIWEGFIPGVGAGSLYKYHIVSRYNGYVAEKADPFACRAEVPPLTASVVWDLSYSWGDGAWVAERPGRNALDAPLSIYEVHAGSWRRVAAEDHRSLSYRELGAQLAEYVQRLGFTHVEFLPVMEHPFFGSWGYQITGYFAPSSRFGSPQDLMALIDCLHQHGIGVLLDWVPSHFPSDGHGLVYFDGTALYEHADPRQAVHPEWGSLIFNYARHEVRSFLISNAFFWLHQYHVDGLRVDAVASMLYLDYARREGEWVPNHHGGRENLAAIGFLRDFNEAVHRHFPGSLTAAEESTAWPGVTRPTVAGGLGFDLKWDMGWMHDTLSYLGHDPIHRAYHHSEITFRSLYYSSERFVLPLSHDEVVYGKGALLRKLPGDDWQKFANLRLLLGYQYAQPGKKLLFMGGEIGQWSEWYHEASLEWHLLEHPGHAGVRRWVEDLNQLYRAQPTLHAGDCVPDGFAWIDGSDSQQSVLSFLRLGRALGRGADAAAMLVVCNFTPVPRFSYRVGVPRGGFWKEVLNSDAREYGGSGMGNLGGVTAAAQPHHNRPSSVSLTLPPLAILFLLGEAGTP